MEKSLGIKMQPTTISWLYPSDTPCITMKKSRTDIIRSKRTNTLHNIEHEKTVGNGTNKDDGTHEKKGKMRPNLEFQ